MTNREDIACARRSALLGGLSDEMLETVLTHSSIRSFGRGASIFLQGEKALNVFVVLDGWVKLFRVTPNGAEAVVAVFTRGQSFGEAVAFRNSTYPVHAEAVTDCRLLCLDVTTLLGTMRARPELFSAVLAASYQHLHDLIGQIEQLKAQTGAQRLAEFLLQLCRHGEGSCTVTLPYDKTLIAGRLGMKPESLSRAFARLRDCGVRVSQNHAAIADVSRLSEFVGQDRADFWRKAE